MSKIFVIATTSMQKKNNSLFKAVNSFKRFVQNKFLEQNLKTKDSFQRILKKTKKNIIITDKFAKSK